MKFSFKALKNDIIVQKTMEATTEGEVLNYLRKNAYIPISITQNAPLLPQFNAIFDKVSFSDIVEFTRQLAIMLNAGLTLVDCFAILEKQITKEGMIAVVQSIQKDVLSGNTFSKALQKYPQHFPNIYIALVKSGEVSGKMSDILLKLADNLEKQREFQGKIKGALTYPIVVLVGMISIMFIMITFVIPKLLTLYESFDIELPLPTRILIALSSFMQSYWLLIIIAVFAGIYFLRNFLKTRAGKKKFDTIILHIPLIQKVIRVAALVTSTRILSILIQAGVPILQSLDIIVDVTTNSVYKDSFIRVRAKIEKGSGLGKSLEDEQIFPPIFVQMTTVGEKTGHLDETLTHLSRYFENEAEMAIRAVTVLIEPLILVVLGVGVGFVVIAVITPIFNLTSSF